MEADAARELAAEFAQMQQKAELEASGAMMARERAEVAVRVAAAETRAVLELAER